MALTKIEIIKLQCSLWLSNKEINILDNYITKQKELESMDKDVALLEMLWFNNYYKYKSYEIDQADDHAPAHTSAQCPLFS